MSIRRVVLTGFMGSGKSTIGPLLAEELGWAFIDIDQQLEVKAGLPASFQTLGESTFRDYESSVIAECMVSTEVVVALGGAAIDRDANRRLLSSSDDCWIVFLDGPFQILIARCLLQESSAGATYRPLLSKQDVALARFHARREWNERIAHQIIDVFVSAIQEITTAIVQRLRH